MSPLLAVCSLPSVEVVQQVALAAAAVVVQGVTVVVLVLVVVVLGLSPLLRNT